MKFDPAKRRARVGRQSGDRHRFDVSSFRMLLFTRDAHGPVEDLESGLPSSRSSYERGGGGGGGGGAKVYIAARNEEKAKACLKRIGDEGHEKGQAEWLHLDLSDPALAKKSAEEFLTKEQRLDIH